jgi:hypothetical protein
MLLVATLPGRGAPTSVETEQPALDPIDSAPPDDLVCRELVELVTGYLDGALPDDWRARVDEHLSGCDGCTAYIGQIQTTILALERLAATEAQSGPGTALGRPYPNPSQHPGD